jgi:tRNA A-37 threonylcarbamoyl transferase component Bud32
MNLEHIPTKPTPESNDTFLKKLPVSVQKQLIDAFGETVNEETLQQKTVDGNEDIFEFFDTELPEELIQRNIVDSKIQKRNLYTALIFFTELVEKRKNTWEINGNQRYKEEALATITTLSSARFDQSLFLGRGNAGHVFVAPETDGGYCIKYLHNPSRQASTLEGEYVILGDVNRIADTFEALKVPQAHCMAKNIEGTKNFFTMEKISGLTLEQLVDFPSKRNSEYPDFTTEHIIELLENKHTREILLRDLSKIHASGVIHGDIHSRNIMLDTHGSLVLIDFGNAVIPVNVSTQATYEHIENVKDLDTKTFINSIEKAVTMLKEQLLTNKN